MAGRDSKKTTKPEKQNLIPRLANRTYHYYKNLTFDYSSCSDEWADAISQAISLIKAQKTKIPARTMAVLTSLEICFCQSWNDETSSELLDEIVSTFGIEYATETVIFWWQIDFDFDYKNEHLTFLLIMQITAGTVIEGIETNLVSVYANIYRWLKMKSGIIVSQNYSLRYQIYHCIANR